jgi:hypothetical protein
VKILLHEKGYFFVKPTKSAKNDERLSIINKKCIENWVDKISTYAI